MLSYKLQVFIYLQWVGNLLPKRSFFIIFYPKTRTQVTNRGWWFNLGFKSTLEPRRKSHWQIGTFAKARQIFIILKPLCKTVSKSTYII